MTYSEKLKDPRWQRKRLEILERDHFACRDCLATDRTLHVHHCHYEKCDPWDARNDVLLTLCEQCHQRRGPVEAEAKLLLARIMAKLPHEPGNQEDLNSFLQGMKEELARDDLDFCPEIINGYIREKWMLEWQCNQPGFEPFPEMEAP